MMGPECPRIGWAAGLQFQLEGVAQSPVGTAQENNAPWDERQARGRVRGRGANVRRKVGGQRNNDGNIGGWT